MYILIYPKPWLGVFVYAWDPSTQETGGWDRSPRLVCVQKTKTPKLDHLGTNIYIFVWWPIILFLDFINNFKNTDENLNNKQLCTFRIVNAKAQCQGHGPMRLLTLCQ